MSTIEKFPLDFTYENAATYFTPEDTSIDVGSKVWGRMASFVTSSTTIKHGFFSEAAMNKLFPNSHAHPISMEYNFASSRPAYVGTAPHHYMYLYVGNSLIDSTDGKSMDLTWATGTSTDSSILNSTRSTQFKFGLKTSNTSCRALGCSSSGSGYYIRLSFNLYYFSAVAGSGISSVSVTSPEERTAGTGYDGDEITYGCEIKNGYEFDGWYDSNDVKVYSTQSFTLTVDKKDLAFTAKAKASQAKLVAIYGNEFIDTFPKFTSPPIDYYYGAQKLGTLSKIGDGAKMKCGGKTANGDIAIGNVKLKSNNCVMQSDIQVGLLNVSDRFYSWNKYRYSSQMYGEKLVSKNYKQHLEPGVFTSYYSKCTNSRTEIPSLVRDPHETTYQQSLNWTEIQLKKIGAGSLHPLTIEECYIANANGLCWVTTNKEQEVMQHSDYYAKINETITFTTEADINIDLYRVDIMQEPLTVPTDLESVKVSLYNEQYPFNCMGPDGYQYVSLQMPVQENKALNQDQSGEIELTGSCVTDFIPIVKGCTSITIDCCQALSNIGVIHEYSYDKQFVCSHSTSAQTSEITLYGDTTYYIKATFNMQNLDSCYIIDNTNAIYLYKGLNFQ